MSNIVKQYNSTGFSFNASIIGHGFGGALASFAAIDIQNQYKSIFVSLITYGQPRVGDANFASYIVRSVNRTERNVHSSDIVPHFPIQNGGFSHFNMEYWY
jgi:predicted lipase